MLFRCTCLCTVAVKSSYFVRETNVNHRYDVWTTRNERGYLAYCVVVCGLPRVGDFRSNEMKRNNIDSIVYVWNVCSNVHTKRLKSKAFGLCANCACRQTIEYCTGGSAGSLGNSSVSNRLTRKSCRLGFGGEVRVKIVSRTHRC